MPRIGPPSSGALYALIGARVTEPIRVEQMQLPSEYGTPSRVLEWDDVYARLTAAKQYWLATVRPDGRPHVVPTDGVWLDGRWYFGGAPTTVKQRNLEADQRVTVHLDDPVRAVIVEGACVLERPTEQQADALMAASREKYGYAPPEGAYLSGVWALQPRKVLAWTDIATDATRFVFA